MGLIPSQRLRQLTRTPHGGPDYRELARLGLGPGDILDFSVNSNPLGPPSTVLATAARLSSETLSRYPDSEVGQVRQMLAGQLHIAPEMLLAGNGSAELIWLLALTYLDPGDHVLVIGPVFGEYAAAAELLGARVHVLNAEEESRFRPPIQETCARIRTLQPRLVFFCNPNNPTGQYVSKEEIEQVCATLATASGTAEKGGLLVLDEAYRNFLADPWDSLELFQRSGGTLILLRSLTKDYALAGLRLGYLVATPEIIATLRITQPPWSVNAIAQELGLAALQSEDYLEQSRARIAEARLYLLGELERLGLSVIPSAVNFFLVRVGQAAIWRSALLQSGIQVRDCTSFGLPAYLRIGIRTLSECQRLVEVLTQLRPILLPSEKK